MSTWLVNYGGVDYTPKALGLTLLGGEWRSGGPSTVRLKAARKFDAAELCAYSTAVTLKRDGSAWFRGTVRPVTKSARGARESHDYLIEDAWADLEILTYQEQWFIRQSDFVGAAYSPRVILGVNAGGTKITVGAQITEALTFAISAGVSLQVGSIPAGMTLWPSEVVGMSCAEVIRTSLRYYPNWIPWLDHTTSPPTFHVTPVDSATARSRSVIGAADVDVTQMNDRVPTGVRIVYETAAMIDDEVYRTMTIDQAPAPTGTTEAIKAALAAAAPKGMLVTHVELQGMKMQIQKQQVVTRTLPTSETGAIAYLKSKFPVIKDIPDAHIDVTAWSTVVIEEDGDAVDPVDIKLTRQYGANRTDLPRELVKGAVAEWMRKKVGRVLVEFTAEGAGAISEEHRSKLGTLPKNLTLNCTNAVTKIYKGVSGYQAGDAVPTGVAAAYLATVQAGCNYAGSIRIKENDVGATRWHGCKLNLTGGAAAWSSMDAPIHSVTWDLASKDVTLGFGPCPDYSVQDYLEFLRLLNKREHTEYTTAERTSDELGSEATVSARGDTVGPLDTPETVTGGGGGASAPPPTGAFFGMTTVDGVRYLQGGTVSAGSGSDTAANIALTNSSGVPLHAAGQHMYVNALGDGILSDGVILAGFDLTSASVGYNATVPSNTLPLAAGATGKRCYVDLGVFTATGFLPNAAGNIQISYCPGAFNVSRY